MPRVLCNMQRNGWTVHFIGPDNQTRVGPWLLFESDEEEQEKVLQWAEVSAEELAEHDRNINRWGCSTVALDFTQEKFRQLIERGVGWPWNGYELEQMRKAGKYPPVVNDVLRK